MTVAADARPARHHRRADRRSPPAVGGCSGAPPAIGITDPKQGGAIEGQALVAVRACAAVVIAGRGGTYDSDSLAN
jgi:hypothetical protein